MSLSVTEYPVNIVGQNLLAGKYPIEIKFKREDIIINSIQVATGETIQVNLNANIASFVNLNEYVKKERLQPRLAYSENFICLGCLHKRAV